MNFFGAIGRIGSGKDEVINYLSAEYNLPTFSVGDMAKHKMFHIQEALSMAD